MSFPGLPQAERYYNEFYRYFWMLENCHPQDEIMYVAFDAGRESQTDGICFHSGGINVPKNDARRGYDWQ